MGTSADLIIRQGQKVVRQRVGYDGYVNGVVPEIAAFVAEAGWSHVVQAFQSAQVIVEHNIDEEENEDDGVSDAAPSDAPPAPHLSPRAIVHANLDAHVEHCERLGVHPAGVDRAQHYFEYGLPDFAHGSASALGGPYLRDQTLSWGLENLVATAEEQAAAAAQGRQVYRASYVLDLDAGTLTAAERYDTGTNTWDDWVLDVTACNGKDPTALHHALHAFNWHDTHGGIGPAHAALHAAVAAVPAAGTTTLALRPIPAPKADLSKATSTAPAGWATISVHPDNRVLIRLLSSLLQEGASDGRLVGIDRIATACTDEDGASVFFSTTNDAVLDLINAAARDLTQELGCVVRTARTAGGWSIHGPNGSSSGFSAGPQPADDVSPLGRLMGGLTPPAGLHDIRPPAARDALLAQAISDATGAQDPQSQQAARALLNNEAFGRALLWDAAGWNTITTAVPEAAAGVATFANPATKAAALSLTLAKFVRLFTTEEDLTARWNALPEPVRAALRNGLTASQRHAFKSLIHPSALRAPIAKTAGARPPR